MQLFNSKIRIPVAYLANMVIFDFKNYREIIKSQYGYYKFYMKGEIMDVSNCMHTRKSFCTSVCKYVRLNIFVNVIL